MFALTSLVVFYCLDFFTTRQYSRTGKKERNSLLTFCPWRVTGVAGSSEFDGSCMISVAIIVFVVTIYTAIYFYDITMEKDFVEHISLRL